MYKLAATFLRAYANLANEMREAGYSEAETAEIRGEVNHFEKVRRLIIDESVVNPKYYEKMSEVLDALIEQRRREALDYKAYLAKIVELTKEVSRPETQSSYPTRINTAVLRALFDNLEGAPVTAVRERPARCSPSTLVSPAASRAFAGAARQVGAEGGQGGIRGSSGGECVAGGSARQKGGRTVKNYA